VVRLSQEWTERWEKQALALRSVFAFGRNNVDPAAGQGVIPDIHYRIWTGQLQYVQTVMDNGAQLLLRGSMQATPDRLLPLERFAIGGVGTVRGYRENSVVRDRGYAVSAEFHYPLLGGGSGHNLTLIPFLDYGTGRNQDETSQKLSSVGLGLNWRWQRLAADLYIAKKLNSLSATDDGRNLQDRGIHFQISYNLF
jgi:hemolysin activation/secretion protein